MEIRNGIKFPTYPDAQDGCTAKETLVLAKGERGFNPASTKRNINGPATVQYIRWADGGVDANIVD